MTEFRLTDICTAEPLTLEMINNYGTYTGLRHSDFTCPITDWVIKIGEPVVVYNGRMYSNSAEIFVCPECGRVYYGRYRDEQHNGICEWCRPNYEEMLNGYLSGYHSGGYRRHPDFELERQRKTVLHAGFELEIAPREEYDYESSCGCHEELWEECGDVLATTSTDGSLPEGGFEIVTKPLTHTTARETISDLCQIIIRNSMCSDADYDCGLHFHLDLEYLCQSHGCQELVDYAKLKTRMLVEALYNSNIDVMRAIDGRHGNYDYCRLSDMKYHSSKHKSDFEKYIVAKKHDCQDHSNAVNVTNGVLNWDGTVNEDIPFTVELRFFAGTDDAFHAQANVDIAFAIGEISKKLSFSECEKYSVNKLYKYLAKNKDTYEYGYKLLKNILR